MVLVDMEFTLHLWWFTATEQKHTKKQIRKLMGSILYKWMLEHVRNKKFTFTECQYPFGRVITTFPFCPSASSILFCCKESTKRCFKLQSYLHQKCWDTCTQSRLLSFPFSSHSLSHRHKIQFFIPPYEVNIHDNGWG